MKVATIFTSAMLVAGALATPIAHEKRQLSEYRLIFDTVSEKIEECASELDAYIAGTLPGTEVIECACELAELINDSADAIAPLNPLSLLDALGLLGPITELVEWVTELADILISAESLFEADGLIEQGLACLYELQAAGENLRDVTLPKVPPSLLSTTEELINRVVTDLQRVIDAFTD
ncbi:hypothetical protein BJX61DRAFT_539161 [Aspergillus egyptiacus]|nr:hypothetical protein BJX61DRAFT_539161 [Aspergillus egyptiacus]